MKTNAFCCRLLLSALSLLLAAGCLTSCGGSAVQETSAAPETTSAVTTTETEAPQEFFKLTGEVCVVRPEGAISDDLLTAVKLMTSAGKALVGGVNVIEDWYRDELVRNEFEILLGVTNRPESGDAYAQLTYHDYMYEVVSPGVVVICGGSDKHVSFVPLAEALLQRAYGVVLTGETAPTINAALLAHPRWHDDFPLVEAPLFTDAAEAARRMARRSPTTREKS